MSLETAFFGYVSTHERLAALVGTRVYEEIAPQDAPVPHLVYQIIGGNRPAYSLQGANGQVENRLEVRCYAANGVARRALADTFRQAIDGFRGSWSGTEIQSVFIDDEGSAFEASPGNEASRVWGWRFDLLITHVETVPTFT